MTKNVTVVDENNYNYGTTYRKRADGLVKTGRACFIDDNTIMLTCPPEISQAEKERLDKIMENNNINNQLTEETEEILSQSTEQNISDTSVSDKPFIEAQIEKIVEIITKTVTFGGDLFITTKEGSEMIQSLFGCMISYKNVEVKLATINAINEMVKSADMDNESVISEIGAIVDTMWRTMNA